MASKLVTALAGLGPAAAPDPAPDAVLLDRFARHRDEAAFATLVDRHGPMVLGVCRRILGDAHAAEDAFQAAFLVLARRAGSLPRPGTLAGWLYGVARRVALKARSAAPTPARPLPRGGTDPPDRRDPLAELTGRELLAVLDEELRRLPAAYRLPVVLCCLEGFTPGEAARRLDCTPGALRGRLARGRARLHGRLAARGLAPAAVLAVATFTRIAGAGVVPLRLRELAAREAVRFATRPGGPAGAMPTNSQLLAEGVLNAMTTQKLAMVAVFLAAILAAGSVLLAGQVPASGPPTEPPRATAPAPKPAGEKPGKDLAALERKLHGRWIGRGFIAPTLTVREDGTFEEGMIGAGGHSGTGTWTLRWDALPPTLLLTYKKSDIEGVAGTTRERKLVRLGDTSLAFENTENSDPIFYKPIVYTRIKK